MVTSIENGMRVITVILNADGSDKTKTRDLSKQIVCWTMWIELIVVVRFLKGSLVSSDRSLFKMAK